MVAFNIPEGWSQAEAGSVGSKKRDFAAYVAELAAGDIDQLELPTNTKGCWIGVQSAVKAEKSLKAAAAAAGVEINTLRIDNALEGTSRLLAILA
jgi:hypothetical protein